MKKFNPIRLFVFFVATIALSKFFEAGRLIGETQTFAHIGMSVFSLLVFIVALLIMGYWIYEEEKEKNNLKHKFSFYEYINSVIARKQSDRSNLLTHHAMRLLRRLFEPPRNDTEGIK